MTLNDSQSPLPPDNSLNTNYMGDEIDIIDLIRPLWQQKIMVATITFAIIAIAVILVLLAPPQYKIYTQLKSGTYRWDKEGTPIPYLKTIDLKNLLASGIFDTYTEQTDFKENAPKISITSTLQGDQLTAAIFWPNAAEGKKILSGYIKFLNKTDRNNSDSHISGLQNQRNSLQKVIKEMNADITDVHLEQQTITSEIEQKKGDIKFVDLKGGHLKREIERINADLNLTKKEVNFLGERIKVAEDTRLGYEKSRQDIDINTTKIISLRNKLLQTPPSDSFQLLLLASTIQQNIAYLNTIDQKIETARKEVISHRTKMAELLKTQEKYHLSIDELNERIKTISLVETIEPPHASTKPVKPNKIKIVTLAGVMGGFIAILCAYGRHFWLTNRERLNNDTITQATN